MPAASTLCLTKGFFDLGLAATLMLAPQHIFQGPINDLVATTTGLPLLNPYVNPAETFALGALAFGAAIGGIRAGRSQSPEAHQSAAALNGSLAITLILAHLLQPTKLASTFSLLIALQDVAWSSALIYYGNFNVFQTFGLTSSPHPGGPSSAGSFNPANTAGGIHIGDLKEEAGRVAGELKREAEVHGITLGNVITGERSMEEKNARGGAVRRDVAGTAERVYQ